jgi:hypothetical protein
MAEANTAKEDGRFKERVQLLYAKWAAQRIDREMDKRYQPYIYWLFIQLRILHKLTELVESGYLRRHSSNMEQIICLCWAYINLLTATECFLGLHRLLKKDTSYTLMYTMVEQLISKF